MKYSRKDGDKNSWNDRHGRVVSLLSYYNFAFFTNKKMIFETLLFSCELLWEKEEDRAYYSIYFIETS